jgi:hypothetical protein
MTIRCCRCLAKDMEARNHLRRIHLLDVSLEAEQALHLTYIVVDRNLREQDGRVSIEPPSKITTAVA